MLCLTKYTRQGPSSRYRVHQFLPYLRSAGIDVEIQPLHDASYFARKDRRAPLYLLRRAVTRLRRIAEVGHFDVVFIQKEIFPYMPDVIEFALAMTRARVVLDIDDAVYLFYRNRPGLRHKFARVIRRADLVLAGNENLAAYARRFSDNVVLFPTVVDIERFAPVIPRTPGPRPVVGWIGGPSTIGNLEPLNPVFERLTQKDAFDLAVVGAEPAPPAGVTVLSKPWSESEEVGDIGRFDIGIMPLDRSEWSEGKCGLKLLQYMSMGIPSVASPRGSAPNIISDGDNGFLADAPDEWESVLHHLIRDEGLRTRVGATGRRWMEDNYNLARYGPVLAEHLVQLAAR